MSYNFNPQPSAAATSSASMITPQAPTPSNVGGSYLATASKQYYSGAVRFAARTVMDDTLLFESGNFPGSLGGVFYASPLCKSGVISVWLQYAPSQQANSGWPRIGQDGNINMLPYFGTDPAYGSMGSIEVELVPIQTVLPNPWPPVVSVFINFVAFGATDTLQNIHAQIPGWILVNGPEDPAYTRNYLLNMGMIATNPGGFSPNPIPGAGGATPSNLPNASDTISVPVSIPAQLPYYVPTLSVMTSGGVSGTTCSAILNYAYLTQFTNFVQLPNDFLGCLAWSIATN